MKMPNLIRYSHTLKWFWIALLTVAGLSSMATIVRAQQEGAVQELTNSIDVNGGAFYTLSDLEEGQTIYIYIAGTSGNLDPIVGVTEVGIDGPALREEFYSRVGQAVNAGRDPLVALPEILDDLFLAWDDDSGDGYDAALAFPVPADGDYQLLVTGTPAEDTAGEFTLMVGLNAPEVLSGKAAQRGEPIAFFNPEASETRRIVQRLSGSLITDHLSDSHTLGKIRPGETLYLFVEATSGNLRPTLILEDYGGKPLRTGNFLGEAQAASMSVTFNEQVSNATVRISACCEGDGSNISTGEYRLLVGVNAPEVLDGAAEESGEPIIQAASPVRVGLRMQQITSVDQKAENFGVVATLQMHWKDPQLAFSPDECQCTFKTFTGQDFVRFVTDNDITWPEFTLFNQQGNRWTQNENVVVNTEGEALYLERFSTTLQAPDFDFTRFPFDVQEFYIRIDSLFPESFYVFTDLEGFSRLGEQLGEEEWIVTDFETIISTETANTLSESSRFSFRFEARRHLSFYVIRIFVPILVIIMVSWVTFFLKDYGKRVDVAAGNLLLFIAFNFTISGDLPRLGYLTFLDTVLISTFVVTALVVLFNVILKRLEIVGKADLVSRLDRYTIWIYPIAYIAALAIVIVLFT